MLSKLRQLHRTQRVSQRGDTIVEVLISIAVISLILGGAYVVSNSSLQATRSAQERGTGLKIAESQLEEIKGLIINNPKVIFSGPVPTTSPFCVYNLTQVLVASDPHCTVTNPGSTQPQYTLSTVRNGNIFSLRETWIDVNGKNTDQLELVYRDYQ